MGSKAEMGPAKKFWRDNSLSIVLFALFFLFLAGLSVAGYRHENETLATHGQPPISYFSYIGSGEFIEAVFENWESEFLQMGALVVLTIWLVQKGSPDSKKIGGRDEFDTSSRYSIIRSRRKLRAAGSFLYDNSLSIALFLLFFASFALHVMSGVDARNQDALQHGEPLLSVASYITSSQFWFESFQNWQSEFLSIGVLILFSIFLRQRHSPQSKPVSEPNAKTGK